MWLPVPSSVQAGARLEKLGGEWPQDDGLSMMWSAAQPQQRVAATKTAAAPPAESRAEEGEGGRLDELEPRTSTQLGNPALNFNPFTNQQQLDLITHHKHSTSLFIALTGCELLRHGEPSSSGRAAGSTSRPLSREAVTEQDTDSDCAVMLQGKLIFQGRERQQGSVQAQLSQQRRFIANFPTRLQGRPLEHECSSLNSFINKIGNPRQPPE